MERVEGGAGRVVRCANACEFDSHQWRKKSSQPKGAVIGRRFGRCSRDFACGQTCKAPFTNSLLCLQEDSGLITKVTTPDAHFRGTKATSASVLPQEFVRVVDGFKDGSGGGGHARGREICL